MFFLLCVLCYYVYLSWIFISYFLCFDCLVLVSCMLCMTTIFSRYFIYLCELFLFVLLGVVFFFFKQKTAYDWRIGDWSSDVCSSELADEALDGDVALVVVQRREQADHGHHRVGDQATPHAGVHAVVEGLDVDEDVDVAAQRGGEGGQADVPVRGVGEDRKSVGLGKSVSVCVDLGGSRGIKQKN